MRGRRHGRPTLFPGGGPHDGIPPAVQEAEVLRRNAELERELERKVRDFARAESVRQGSEARGSGRVRVGPGRDTGLARGFLLS